MFLVGRDYGCCLVFCGVYVDFIVKNELVLEGSSVEVGKFCCWVF